MAVRFEVPGTFERTGLTGRVTDMVLIRILLWVLLILLVLPPALMLIPFQYRISGKADAEEKKVYAHCRWLFGLLVFEFNQQAGTSRMMVMKLFGFQIDLTKNDAPVKNEPAREEPVREEQPYRQGKTAGERSSKKDEPVPPSPSPPGQKQKKTGKRLWEKRADLPVPLSQILSYEVFHELKLFLKRLWRMLRPDEFILEAVYGLSDPYQTARINNWLLVLTPIFPTNQLHIRPLFHDTVFKASGRIRGSLIPIAFVWVAFRLLLAKPVRRIWWPLAKYAVKVKRSEQKRRKHYAIQSQ